MGGEEHEPNLEASENILAKVSSEKNRSDLGTKHLDFERHWYLLGKMRMIRLREVRELLRLASSIQGSAADQEKTEGQRS